MVSRLASDRPNDNDVTVTHIMESDSWTRSRTSTNPDIGCVKANIRCFGLPVNHQGTLDENKLEFQAMLAEGKTVLKYDIPVGHLIKSEHPSDKRGDNLDLYLELELDPPFIRETAPFGFNFKQGEICDFVLHIGLTSVKLDAAVEKWGMTSTETSADRTVYESNNYIGSFEMHATHSEHYDDFDVWFGDRNGTKKKHRI